MGNPGLPKELTAEETALKKLYNELKKAKKQLQEHKAAKKLELQQASTAAHQGTKRSHSENAEEATAQAKKLLKAGAIKLEAENKEKKFKRTVVKKAKDSERSTSVFQPFVPASESPEPGYRPRGAKHDFKNLYACFVSSGTTASSSSNSSVGASASGGSGSSSSVGSGPSSSSGKILYVSGNGLTESLVRKAFSSYTSVTNVIMEQGKCSGFVTLSDSQSADEAVERLNGSVLMDVALTVEVARRQHQPPSRSTSQTSLPGTPVEKGAAAWTELAQNRSKKGSESMTDQRALVTYDESDMFS